MYSWYVFRQKCSLSHVLQYKTGIYDTGKSQPDRCSGEVAKISKHSLSTCDSEKYSAKRYPTILSSSIEKLHNIVWRKSNKYSRIPVNDVI